MIIYTPAEAAKKIPVIDIGPSFSADGSGKKAVAWEIHKACRETGFFYVANHGVPEEVVKRQLACSKEFFELPLASKEAVNVGLSSTMRGYEPMAIQTLDDGSKPDLKEGFMAGIDGGQAYVSQGAYNSLNQWPRELTAMQDQTEEYIASMVALGRHLLGLIALSLDLREDFFEDGLKQPMITTRLLHYPPQPGVGDGNQLGAGAHTDWGMLTILFQDDVGGLEVRNADGDWVKAPYVQGTFVINLGDMMPVLTKGLYNSNMHRVLNTSPNRDRYSIATFFDPNFHYQIVPLKSEADLDSPAAPPVTVGEHIAAMYAKTYG